MFDWLRKCLKSEPKKILTIEETAERHKDDIANQYAKGNLDPMVALASFMAIDKAKDKLVKERDDSVGS